MTRNQHRSIELARQLVLGTLNAEQLSDEDWNLLLLAAGLNNPRSLPPVVAHRVLNQAAGQNGYFSNHHQLSLDRTSLFAAG